MRERPLRYGVIGTGMMGREHIANIMAIPGTEVAALADPNADSLALAREMVDPGEDACHASYQDLLAGPPLDVIVIATPNDTHQQVAVDVLSTESHVLIEKPLATTVSGCDEIIEAAQGREAITWMGLEYRYKPAIARLIDETHRGVVGHVRMVAIREHRYPFLVKVDNWNRFRSHSGGTLVEKCCHFFDLMNLILRDQPTRVYASGAQDVNHLDELYEQGVPDMIDNAYVIVDYANGARALLDLCMFAEGSKNEQELAVTGDVGKVEAFVPESIVRIGNRATWKVEEHQVTDDNIAFMGAHEGSSYLEHLDLIAAIDNGQPARVTLEDGRLAVAMGVAGQISMDEGRPVSMSEVL